MYRLKIAGTDQVTFGPVLMVVTIMGKKVMTILFLKVVKYLGCSNISAMDILAQDVLARTFQPRIMPKVDVSAITINCGWADGCMHGCIHACVMHLVYIFLLVCKLPS